MGLPNGSGTGTARTAAVRNGAPYTQLQGSCSDHFVRLVDITADKRCTPRHQPVNALHELLACIYLAPLRERYEIQTNWNSFC